MYSDAHLLLQLLPAVVKLLLALYMTYRRVPIATRHLIVL